MNLGIVAEFSSEFDFSKVEQVIRNVLLEQGFGILTEIDVKRTMKEKLNLEYRPYKILGACNPSLANKALSVEPEIGLLLPCNVIIYEKEDRTIRVSITKPTKLFELIQINGIEQIANEVEEIMRKVIENAKIRLSNQ